MEYEGSAASRWRAGACDARKKARKNPRIQEIQEILENGKIQKSKKSEKSQKSKESKIPNAGPSQPSSCAATRTRRTHILYIWVDWGGKFLTLGYGSCAAPWRNFRSGSFPKNSWIFRISWISWIFGFLGFLGFLGFFGFFGGVFSGDHATTLEKFVSFLKLRGRAGRGRNPRGPTFPGGSTHIYNSRVGRLLVAALQGDVFESEVFIILVL